VSALSLLRQARAGECADPAIDALLIAGYSLDRARRATEPYNAVALAARLPCEARLARALERRGRFAGRAELTRAAQVGNAAALVALETRLGIATPGAAWVAAEEWRRAHAASLAPRVPGPAPVAPLVPVPGASLLYWAGSEANRVPWESGEREIERASLAERWPGAELVADLLTEGGDRLLRLCASAPGLVSWASVPWESGPEIRRLCSAISCAAHFAALESSRPGITAALAAWHRARVEVSAEQKRRESEHNRATAEHDRLRAQWSAQRDRIRAERARDRPTPPAPCSPAVAEYIRRAIVSAARGAGLRTATHAHEDVVHVVAEGDERVTSSTAAASPSSVGLPNAYSRKGYSVTASTHTWCVSTALLRIPADERYAAGRVQYAPGK